MESMKTPIAVLISPDVFSLKSLIHQKREVTSAEEQPKEWPKQSEAFLKGIAWSCKVRVAQ